MKLLNKITISLIFLPLIAFISCSNKETTGSNSEEEKTFASYAGNWYGDPDNVGEARHLFIINSDGSLTVKGTGEGGADETVPASDITKNSNTNYIVQGAGIFTFSSDTQGTFAMTEGGVTYSVVITKR